MGFDISERMKCTKSLCETASIEKNNAVWGGLVRNNNNLTIIVMENLFGCGCRGFVKGTQYFICDACVWSCRTHGTQG